LSHPLWAQNSTLPDSLKVWKKGGTFSLSFSQVSLTNWSAGGENSLSGTTLVNLFANSKKGKHSWDNALDMGYGFLKSGNDVLHKSDDKMELSSKYGYTTSKHWNIAALVNFKSQFAPGYNFPNDSDAISDFLAPGYLLIALGMDYKPNDNFSFFISPLTGKITFVNNQELADAGAYGVERAEYDTAGVKIKDGKKIRSEFGALISMKIQKEIFKNISVSTKVDLFSNYAHNPGNIDVNWDFLLTLKVNDHISATITTTLIYDDDILVPLYSDINGVRTQTGAGPRTQFKEVLGIAITYKL